MRCFVKPSSIFRTTVVVAFPIVCYPRQQCSSCHCCSNPSSSSSSPAADEVMAAVSKHSSLLTSSAARIRIDSDTSPELHDAELKKDSSSILSSAQPNDTTAEDSEALLHTIRTAVDAFFHKTTISTKSQNLSHSLLRRAAVLITDVGADDAANIFAGYAVVASEMQASDPILPFEFLSEVSSVAYVVTARLRSGLMSDKGLERVALSAAFMLTATSSGGTDSTELWEAVLDQLEELVKRIVVGGAETTTMGQSGDQQESVGADGSDDNNSNTFFEATRRDMMENAGESDVVHGGAGGDSDHHHQMLLHSQKIATGVLFAMKRRVSQAERKMAALSDAGREPGIAMRRTLAHARKMFERGERVVLKLQKVP